jgi:PEP-CTERM motif
MSRLHVSLVALLITVACLSVGAYATPIAGAGVVAPHSFSSFGGKVYNSSLSGEASEQSHLSLITNNSGSGHVNIAPHQFSLRVPPPTDSQTPEPSTLILFGSGLMMVGGAVRRKFRR